jgi:hypothetical protein
MVALLNVAPPDALVARANLERWFADRPADVRYLEELGADAVPTIVAHLDSIAPDQREDRWLDEMEATQFTLASDLLCDYGGSECTVSRSSPKEYGEGGRVERPGTPTWRTWNLAEKRARDAVSAHRDELLALCRYKKDGVEWFCN